MFLPQELCYLGCLAFLGGSSTKLAGGNITTRFFWQQPDYQGKHRIKVTMCNVLMELGGDILAAYLSIYGGVEQVTQITSNSGTAYGDYVFIMCLNRGRFNNIPHIIKYWDQSMMVVVEGRRLLCWSCKQLGHFSRTYPQKMTTTTTTSSTTATMTSLTTTTATTATEKTTAPTIKEIDDHPNKKVEEGWIQVTRKGWGGKNSPQNSLNKQTVKTTTTTTANTIKTMEATESTTKSPVPIIEEKMKSTVSSNKKKKKKEHIFEEEHVQMDTTTNLKRKRDSDDNSEEGKKKVKNNQTQSQRFYSASITPSNYKTSSKVGL